MFGHDDNDDDKKEEAVTVDPVVSPVVDDNTTIHSDADDVAPVAPAEPLSTPEEKPAETPAAPADQSLLDLKKQALEELSPLVEHLDQTPEEKFKTTMMLIQATDSSNLISAAHEAAKAITDEKVRAQALLDIVNEINYFTQK